LFRIVDGFLHVPTTQIYCLTGAIISETLTIITIHNTFALKGWKLLLELGNTSHGGGLEEIAIF
jgi:hypothetical protein